MRLSRRTPWMGPVACLVLLVGLWQPGPARGEASEPSFSRSSLVDGHASADEDTTRIARPRDWEPNFWGHQFREALVEPLSHMFDVPDKLLFLARLLGIRSEQEAANVNDMDEVHNSSWFTNRNHVRAVSIPNLLNGPDGQGAPPKPWTVTSVKKGGTSPGFQIKDASGQKWLVKLDPPGYPQLSSGADMIARTLFQAAGFNVPHNVPARFRRSDLLTPRASSSAAGEVENLSSKCDSILALGAVFPDSSYSALASRFLSGHVLGAPSMRWRRPEDDNDQFRHTDRRELRGLYVLCSWVGNWDTKDHNMLDVFIPAAGETLGHVEHYVLDLGSSLGASSTAPKELSQGYEQTLDLGWTGRRLFSLGFAVEPWRVARQESGIPAVGNFESAVFEPQSFASLQAHACFREMTDRDAYWGAKIVASFSDAQIQAVVDAAHYEDPRASEYLVRCLVQRRDKIARYWFGRVAPLDFFAIQSGELRFHDLSVELGLTAGRSYELEVDSEGGELPGNRRLHLDGPAVTLASLDHGASRLTLEFRIAGSAARPAHVLLVRRGLEWTVASVRHG